MGKIKVGIIIPVKFPRKGGYENLLFDLSKEMQKYAQIQLICTRNSPKTKIDSINLFPILNFSKLLEKVKGFGFLANFLFNQFRFFLYLLREKPHVINAHPSYPTGLIALPAKLLGIPIICTSHGSDIQVNQSVNYGQRRDFLSSVLTRITLKLCNFHTLVSQSMVDDALLAGSSREKIRVIYNGINPEKLLNKESSSIISRLEIQKTDFVVLFLGRLHPKKCPMDLIKAATILIQEITNLRVIFAGKGEEFNKLKKFRKLNKLKNVELLGFVGEREKIDLLERCDVFVLPSLIEGHPITLIEAMALGKAIITSNAPPFPEFIHQEINGVMVPVNKPILLAKGIKRLWLDENLRETISKQCLLDFRKEYHIRTTARKYFKLFIRAIKKGR